MTEDWRRSIDNGGTFADQQHNTLSVGPCKCNYDLATNISAIETLPTIKILGVELDSRLPFKERITKQLQKVYAKSVRGIRRFVPSNVMLRL